MRDPMSVLILKDYLAPFQQRQRKTGSAFRKYLWRICNSFFLGTLFVHHNAVDLKPRRADVRKEKA